MPTSFVNDPKHWQDRAAEMRALADGVKDKEARTIMLRLADDCDKLAIRVAKRSAGEPVSDSNKDKGEGPIR